MKNYIQPGHTVTITAAAALTSGQGLLQGSLFGVVAASVANTEQAELQVVGVFELPKKSADTPAALALAYWDDTLKEVTTTSTDNTLIGVFTKAYGNGDTLAHVRLNGTSV